MGSQAPELSNEDIARFGPEPQSRFRTNMAALEARIVAACSRAGRERGSVRLLPVTKTVPAHILRFAHQAGICSFGENRMQEAMAKHEALADLDIDWCIIGHLQTNKVKYLARFAHEFHALDSLRLAEMLDRRMAQEGRVLDVYIQVNTSGEASKFGLPPDQVADFVKALPRFAYLRPRGLMTLALFSGDMAKVRPCFVRLRQLRDAVQREHPQISGLSMGMSGDFETAIEEGATVIRVGQAIFGARPTSDAFYWPGFAPSG